MKKKRVLTWLVLLLILFALIFTLLRSSSDKEPGDVDVGSFYTADESVPSADFQADDESLLEAQGVGSQNLATSQRPREYIQPPEKVTTAQLLQAKAEVEFAKQQNERKRAQLEQSMQAERAELESLLKVDIGYHIENWRKAWQAGDIDTYLKFYSSQFEPREGQSLAEWQTQRRSRVSADKKIGVLLSDFTVNFEDDYARSKVSFMQNYSSGDGAGNYQEQSRKQLILLKQRQEWKIVSETELK